VSARGIVRGLRAAGASTLVAHPDSWLAPLLTHADEQGIRVLPVSREEEGLAVAAGIAIGGGRACLAIQNAGFLSMGNTIATLVEPYGVPIVMLISQRGTLGDGSVYQAPKGRRTPKVLDAFDLAWDAPGPDADWEQVMQDAFRIADSLANVYCLLLDRGAGA